MFYYLLAKYLENELLLLIAKIYWNNGKGKMEINEVDLGF